MTLASEAVKMFGRSCSSSAARLPSCRAVSYVLLASSRSLITLRIKRSPMRASMS